MCPVCGSGTPRFACRALLFGDAARDVFDCPDCGSSYFWPVPPESEVARCYPHSYFEDFFRQYWKDYYNGRSLAEELTAWREKGAILDVGCAVGTLLAGVRDHSKWAVTGMEASPAAAEAARELHKLEVFGGLGEARKAGPFDFVRVNNVLEHVRDPKATLSDIRGMLSDGGRLELTIPNGPTDLLPTRTLYERLDKAVRTKHAGHLFFLSRTGLLRLFEAAGLRPLKFESFHFKTALKARGLTRGAYKLFLGGPEKRKLELPLEQCRGLIPERPGWTWHRLRQRWRRLFAVEGSELGYDFRILAERV